MGTGAGRDRLLARPGRKGLVTVGSAHARGERMVVGSGRGRLRPTRTILLTALFGTLSGCVTVRSAPARFDAAWPPPVAGPRPSVALVMTGEAVEYGWPRDLGPILPVW